MSTLKEPARASDSVHDSRVILPHETPITNRIRLDPLFQSDEGVIVAANCDICGKGPSFGHNVSHSQRKTNRRWNPNIQRVRALVGKTPKRLNVCTAGIKAGKVVRAS